MEPKPGITFDASIVAVWYMELGGGDNYLAALSKTPTGHRLVYRFRYSGSDTRPFEGNDTRSWYEGTLSEQNSATVIEKCRGVIKAMAAVKAGSPNAYDEILMDGEGFDGFMRRFMAMPWVHAKVEPGFNGATVTEKKDGD